MPPPLRQSLPRAVRRARYRTGQFLLGLNAALSAGEVDEVRALLSRAELHLFASMEARDRRHSVNVMRRIEVTSGAAPPSRALRRAALLHDVGKGPLWVWERVAFVLLEALSPRLVDAIGAPRGPRWRRGLWRLRHHARLGAEVLGRTGTDERVRWLVAHHLDEPAASHDPELALLMEADRAS